MSRTIPQWLAPTSLQEALALRAQLGDEATVVAGGTFIGILMNQKIMQPQALLSLRNVSELAFIEASQDEGSLLRIGAMTTHRAVERSPLIRQQWPVLASTFSLVASPRVRNQATVGGVLADADYASDPPALLQALNARVVARSEKSEREIPVEELIIGYYETSLHPVELLIEVRVPRNRERVVYRKFRSRSSEDRPCVAVAAAQVDGKLRVVVGAVAEKPQYFPEICALAEGETGGYTRELVTEIAQRYAESIEPISDSRGSATYRRRVIAVEVRRALEEMVP
ncbi:MAG TPA: FAD binding domain-containing protein [Ktedonobacteraceae bacterium]